MDRGNRFIIYKRELLFGSSLFCKNHRFMSDDFHILIDGERLLINAFVEMSLHVPTFFLQKIC